MDQATRNKLRNVVTQCRKLLEDSISQQLQGQFGIYAGNNGNVQVEDESRMSHLSDDDQQFRRDLLDHFEHIKARGFKPKDALDQLVRETAFTHLNRLCAYKMMEARDVYVGGRKFREAVSRGINSNGFKFYLADHPDDERLFNTGQQEHAYRHFLDWLGGLLSEEIGVLFNPNDPANRLYPRQKTLDELLDLLNGADIKPEETELRETWPEIWEQDETIGWVYQYFTPKELRDQARKESSAPRNSYELAFRNQFFTPRYVVEFLTDNTLGRIWYEVRKGDTKLADQCRCMVRRPTEVFLDEGQEPQAPDTTGVDLSREELLKQPVQIPHRPKKDPRELRVLDPACGSGHFLLYCFDLLLTIYDEAYEDSDLGPNLKADYSDKTEFTKAVPGLILAHNLHGIDIDLRASQIAALALWLRCQRVFRELGLKDPPKIARSNIVCAEPMPGEKEMLKEFTSDLKPRVLGQLVEVVFNKMKLAGEAGSLLKIEDELRHAIAEAKKQWQEAPKEVQLTLFESRKRPKRPEQQLLFDTSGITDGEFWDEAEVNVLSSLRDYATQAANRKTLQRQLFADDAIRGFAFIDISQRRFDVVLMNPPFGATALKTKGYVEASYSEAKYDIYACFVERGLTVLQLDGVLGAITSRAGFFLSTFEDWRDTLISGTCSLTTCVDLGMGVLDTAMVETAAYCVDKSGSSRNAVFVQLLNEPEKGPRLSQIVRDVVSGKRSPSVFIKHPSAFRSIPRSPFAYWVSDKLCELFESLPPFESANRKVRGGLKTGDDFRFVRAWWEVPLTSVAIGNSVTTPDEFRSQSKNGRRWVTFAKGGEFSPYHCDLHLVVDWLDDGAQSWEFYRIHHKRVGGVVRNPDVYFKPGLTWAYRTHRLCLQELPAGAIISVRGSGIFADPETLRCWLSLGNSLAVDEIVKLGVGRAGHPQFNPGDLQVIPYPHIADDDHSRLKELGLANLQLTKQLRSSLETARCGTMPALLQVAGTSLGTRIAAWEEQCSRIRRELSANQEIIDGIAFRIFGFRESVGTALRGNEANDDSGNFQHRIDDEPPGVTDWNAEQMAQQDSAELVEDLVSYCVGCAFGRWDIRLATSGVPELPRPFEPLPAGSPGLLKPATVQELPHDYPFDVDLDGILVDDAEHRDDILRRVRQALEVAWNDGSVAVEDNAAKILGTKTLRSVFGKSAKGGFWYSHLSRYSKSGRKAPIYWLLQSSKKNYALWLYYHRLDKDMLFKALLNYVEPKIQREENHLGELRSQKASAGESGKRAKKLDREIEKQEDLLSELRDFAEKLRKVADLHLVPDLNDGVVLNIAPLHELVPWKEAKKYWNELLDGKYEWSSIGKQLREKGLVK